MIHKLALATSLFGMMILTGCQTGPVVPPKTQLQVREMQTRNYRNRDIKMTMKAVINALQDDGFLVKNADKELGFITATKEVDIEDGGDRFFSIMMAGRYSEPRYSKNSVVEASVNVSEFGKESRVRAIFSKKILDNLGGTVSVAQVDNDKYYQDFFAEVDKSLFIEKEKL